MTEKQKFCDGCMEELFAVVKDGVFLYYKDKTGRRHSCEEYKRLQKSHEEALKDPISQGRFAPTASGNTLPGGRPFGIEVSVQAGQFEPIKLTVSGTFQEREQMREDLIEGLRMFGQMHQGTALVIEGYIHRVLEKVPVVIQEAEKPAAPAEIKEQVQAPEKPAETGGPILQKTPEGKPVGSAMIVGVCSCGCDILESDRKKSEMACLEPPVCNACYKKKAAEMAAKNAVKP